MSQLKPTSIPILGLLREGPRSGYEIRRSIDNSVGFFWQESFGQLYPELNRLLKIDMIAIDQEQKEENKRRKRIYRITEAGEKALCDWLLIKPHVRPLREELLIKLFFSQSAELGAMIDHLIDSQARVEEVHEQLKQIDDEFKTLMPALSSSLRLKWMTANYGMAIYAAQIEWHKRTIKDLKALLAAEKEVRT